MNKVDEYIDSFNGMQKEWLTALVTFMRENYPNIGETIFYQMPTYKFNGTYIGFSVAKSHFTFHTLDFEFIEIMKELLPKASFGRGCAKVKYTNKEAIPVLLEACSTIIKRSS